MSILIISSAVVLVAFAAYLVEFGLVSRRDSLKPAVDSARARRARRVSGVYVRDLMAESKTDIGWHQEVEVPVSVTVQTRAAV